MSTKHSVNIGCGEFHVKSVSQNGAPPQYDEEEKEAEEEEEVEEDEEE